ncbi:HTH domain-containing protein [Lysinibacillus capsici]|uniref:HTH domain-containing protein n=1 Tax=Lysinibacillus capsici TaxID=2115968 RepID=UPI001CD91DAE|nr:HTH domain-containing protein [Lysinibacillus capsici]
MKKLKDRAEVSFVTNISRYDYLKQQIQEVAEKFSFNHQQLAKIFDLPMKELDSLLNNKGSITKEQLDKIERKIAMLYAGFEGFDARERAALLLNDLIKEYMFSTDSVAKMIHVEEKDLIDFRQALSMDKNVELKICVNSIMLHFVLHN